MNSPSRIRRTSGKLHRHSSDQYDSRSERTVSNVTHLVRVKSNPPPSGFHNYPIREEFRTLPSTRSSFLFADMKTTGVTGQHFTGSKPQTSILDNHFPHNSNGSLVHNRVQPEIFTNIQELTASKNVPIKMTSYSIPSNITRMQSLKRIAPVYDYDPIQYVVPRKLSVRTILPFQPTAKIICSNPELRSIRRTSRRKPVVMGKKEEETRRPRRRRDGCFAQCCLCCSPCCCWIIAFLLTLLFLAALILLLVLLLTTAIIPTDSTTTTINTITMTMTTTTSETTTTTTSTSSSASVTTSTSTSSTSSTATTTTTTTAATVTITSNTCTSGWKGVTVLYHCDNCPDIAPYTQYTYTYTAIANQTRIAFAFREDVGSFALDTVSVRSTTAPTVELILNNDFETGTMSSWTYCNPLSASAAGAVMKNSDNLQHLSYTYQAKTGTHFYFDGAVGSSDYLFQKFATDIGSTYTISFWLYNRGSGSASSADVIISF